jgi:hypothetical protein
MGLLSDIGTPGFYLLKTIFDKKEVLGDTLYPESRDMFVKYFVSVNMG